MSLRLRSNRGKTGMRTATFHYMQPHIVQNRHSTGPLIGHCMGNQWATDLGIMAGTQGYRKAERPALPLLEKRVSLMRQAPHVPAMIRLGFNTGALGCLASSAESPLLTINYSSWSAWQLLGGSSFLLFFFSRTSPAHLAVVRLTLHLLSAPSATVEGLP